MRAVTQSFTNRINALDLVRGWCLVVIAADHLTRFPSIFDPLTGRGLLWVTAAEGFFFISGMLVGIARGKDMGRGGLWVATKKLWARAGKLYIASVILTLIFTVAGYMLAQNGIATVKGGLQYFGSIWSLLSQTLTLNYNYGWADFLTYYAVYLFISPAALWLLHRKLWWVVVTAVLVLWLVKTAVPLPFPFWYGIWQAYFFLGIVCGYHFNDIKRLAQALSATSARRARRALIAVAAATVAASFAFTFGTEFFEGPGRALGGILAFLHLPSAETLHAFFYNVKENTTFKLLFQELRTGLLRLPLFFIWIGALFVIVWRYETWIMRHLGWLLLPLGRNSLYVYIVESFLIFGILLLPLPNAFIPNSLVILTVIALAWLAVKNRLLFGIIPR